MNYQEFEVKLLEELRKMNENNVVIRPVLKNNGIKPPDYSSVERFSYERTSDEMPDKDRELFFGFGVNADELSILLDK